MRTAYIAMGANLPSPAGPPEATLTAAAERLGSLGRITRRSSLYSTLPVGFADQPRFVNAVVELETGLEPQPLLEALMVIEQEFGRDRSTGVPNGPRTLDLDILLLGGVQMNKPGLAIPHPRLSERSFVLIPLCEISPSIVHVARNQTVKQLLHNLSFGAKSGDDAAIPVHWEGWVAGQIPDRTAGAGRGAHAGAGAAESDSDHRR